MSDMPQGAKGHVSTEKTIWCGICPHWDQQPYRSTQEMVKYATLKGWKRHRHYGWICPDCVAERRDPDAADAGGEN